MEKSLEKCYGKSNTSTTVFVSPFRTKVPAYSTLSSQVFWAKPCWGAELSRRHPPSIPWDFTTTWDTTRLYSLPESTAYSFLLLCFTSLSKSLLQNMVIFFWLIVCLFLPSLFPLLPHAHKHSVRNTLKAWQLYLGILSSFWYYW